MSNTNQGSNYMIHKREFINSGEKIIKIGLSKQNGLKHMAQCSKGSILVFQRFVTDCIACKKEIIKNFDIKFKNRPDIGRDYYEGDIDEMMYEFMFITNKFSYLKT